MILVEPTSVFAGGGRRGAHVVVLGNEKGGSGKSTIAMHVAVALMKAGQRVATVDLDCRQKSLTHYVENRRALAARHGVALELSDHFAVERGTHATIEENEQEEFSAFASAITTLEHTHDYVLIDTPGSDSYLMRLAHAMADTLVTPLNDSFVDFDVLARVDPETADIVALSQYSEVVTEARRQRRLADGGDIDWAVVRNRVGQFDTKNGRSLERALGTLSGMLGFRYAEGVSERVVYRELFLQGLTALDELERFGIESSLTHHTARMEVRRLLEFLQFPVEAAKGRRSRLWFGDRRAGD